MKVGYCGDLCDFCPKYRATVSGSEEDLKKVVKLMQKVGWRCNPEDLSKNRCRGCQDVPSCEYGVKECCQERKLANCGECTSYPCVKIKTAFKITQENADKFKRILSEDDYEQCRKAFFSKKANLDATHNKSKRRKKFPHEG